MKKLILSLILALVLIGCADSQKRMDFIQKKYPKTVIMPSLPMGGNISTKHIYDVIVKDTINELMYGVDFYMGSETSIYNIDLLLYYK